MSYAVWHPYTQMSEWDSRTMKVITRGKGFYLIDENGNRYLDGIASMWCNVWGHGKNEIIKIMIKQLRDIEHSTLFGLSSRPSIELAEKLLKMSKGMSYVFYSDNGSTAIEVAIVVLPTSVSVPVINIPFIKGYAWVLVVINDKDYGLFKSQIPYHHMLRRLYTWPRKE